MNFIQGTKISLDEVLSIGYRNEFHHIYPKDYLGKSNENYAKEQINCLANFTLLSRTDNKKITNKPPSQYKPLMPGDQQTLENILQSHLCNISMFDDDYDSFLRLRAKLLVDKAKELCL